MFETDLSKISNMTDSEKGLNSETDLYRYDQMREMSCVCGGMPHGSYPDIC